MMLLFPNNIEFQHHNKSLFVTILGPSMEQIQPMPHLLCPCGYQITICNYANFPVDI